MHRKNRIYEIETETKLALNVIEEASKTKNLIKTSFTYFTISIIIIFIMFFTSPDFFRIWKHFQGSCRRKVTPIESFKAQKTYTPGKTLKFEVDKRVLMQWRLKQIN